MIKKNFWNYSCLYGVY